MLHSASSFRKMVSPCFSSPSICAIVPAWKTPTSTWSEFVLSCLNSVMWGCSASQTNNSPAWSFSLHESPNPRIHQDSSLNYSENVLNRNTKSRLKGRDFLLKASVFLLWYPISIHCVSIQNSILRCFQYVKDTLSDFEHKDKALFSKIKGSDVFLNPFRNNGVSGITVSRWYLCTRFTLFVKP